MKQERRKPGGGRKKAPAETLSKKWSFGLFFLHMESFQFDFIINNWQRNRGREANTQHEQESKTKKKSISFRKT